MKQTDYNKIPWNDYFYASTDSKSGIKWKVERRSGAKYQRLLVSAGDDAGTVQYRKTGETMGWKIVLDGTTYLAHRILYVLLHGSMDITKVIDHLNGNNIDNTPSNLALKDWKGNAQNHKKHINNTSGFTGVTLSTDMKNWRARWATGIGREQGSKNFSIAKHGYETAKQLAIDHRNLQISLLNASGASYTSRHTGSTPEATPVSQPAI